MQNVHPLFQNVLGGLMAAAPTPVSELGAAELLTLVRVEASKFGRCCDQHQDSLGTFCCVECGQRTMAMLKGVQELLGIRKDGEPVDCAEETAKAHAEAVDRNRKVESHAGLVADLAAIQCFAHRDESVETPVQRLLHIERIALAAITKATLAS